MAIVPGIFLDHVGVYPTEGNGVAASYSGVVEAVARSGLTAGLALGFPDR